MLNSLLSPLRTGVLLAVLLVLAWRWLPRWMRIVGTVPVLICLSLSLPLIANPLVRYQESRVAASRLCASAPPDTLVVVSGGSTRLPVNAVDFTALSESSLRRLLAAVEQWQRQTDAILVISGGASRSLVPESVLMAALAERMGVPPSAIRLETQSHTTWQNAQFVREMEGMADRRIALVTSALHMPRALYAFEQAGFDVCVWPADSRYARANSFGYYLPSNAALDKSYAVVHEWVGEIAYRMGWLRSTTRDPWSGADEY